MGRCHEFGSQIREGCGHPMRAGERACACPECGVVCEGQFDGCPDVWARGPRPISLTVAPAIAAPRARALVAGPTPAVGPPTPPPLGSGPPLASNGNGHTNGRTHGAPPPPPPPPGDPNPPSAGAGAPPPAARTEILRWFEDAFDELRNELHAVVSAVSRQQAMLAELLDSREAELRVVMVAESLPELAGEAAAKALNDQSDTLADEVSAALDEFRTSVRSSHDSSTEIMDGMRELLRRVEVTAEVNTEEARLEGAARLEALKASVGRQLRPVAAAVADVAASLEETEEREAARTRALKASVARQLQPLATALEAAVERSDRQLADIHARLDALGAPKTRAPRARSPKPPAPAPKPAARKAPAAKKAPAATRTKTAAPAPVAAAARPKPPAPAPTDQTSILYDYESPEPAPPAVPPALESLLARRRATARRPPLD